MYNIWTNIYSLWMVSACTCEHLWSCMWVVIHLNMLEHVCGSQRTSSVSVFVFYLVGDMLSLLLPTTYRRLTWLQASSNSPASASHLPTGPLELLTHIIAPDFAWVLGIHTPVLTLAWQMFSTPNHLPRPQSVINFPEHNILLTVSFLPGKVCRYVLDLLPGIFINCLVVYIQFIALPILIFSYWILEYPWKYKKKCVSFHCLTMALSERFVDVLSTSFPGQGEEPLPIGCWLWIRIQTLHIFMLTCRGFASKNSNYFWSRENVAYRTVLLPNRSLVSLSLGNLAPECLSWETHISVSLSYKWPPDHLSHPSAPLFMGARNLWSLFNLFSQKSPVCLFFNF